MKTPSHGRAISATRNSPAHHVVGLFAGIGGFELGLSRAGLRTELLCEIDPGACAVLDAHFGDVERVRDVRKLSQLPKNTTVVCAGFPCQDLSSVGQKQGIAGSRSSLVEHVFRLLRKTPVEWVIIENVFFMLHLNKGAGIRTIVDRLERLGYNWAYRVIDSAAFGVPQRRRRVFVVASLSGDPRNVLLSGDCDPSQKIIGSAINSKVPLGFYWTEGMRAAGLAVNAIPPLKGGSTVGIPSPPAILFPDGTVVTPHINDAERLQGFPAGWTEPAVSVSRASFRWRLVGNAVTTNVAEWLGQKIRRPQPYDFTKDQWLASEHGWPNAAWSVGKKRFRSTVSAKPTTPQTSGIDTFLQFPTKPLSPKAVSGFLHRVSKGSLKFPPDFLQHLNTYLERSSCIDVAAE